MSFKVNLKPHCENICKCVQRNLAPLGKPPPHQNEALLFVDFETWQFRKKQAGVSKAPVRQRQPPLCGSLSPLCVFLSIWFWPLFTVSIISIPARRLGEAKRDDIIIFLYLFFPGGVYDKRLEGKECKISELECGLWFSPGFWWFTHWLCPVSADIWLKPRISYFPNKVLGILRNARGPKSEPCCLEFISQRKQVKSLGTIKMGKSIQPPISRTNVP